MRHAFTLVEVLVALLIVAVVSAIAVPALARPEPRRAMKAAGDVVRRITVVRVIAAERGERVRLSLDATTGAFRVSSDEPAAGDGVIATGRIDLNGVRVVGSARLRTWLADPLGPLVGDELVLIGPHADTVRVTADPWTGATRAVRR